jgi:hypothetical protein
LTCGGAFEQIENMTSRVFKLIRCRGLLKDGGKTLFFRTAGGDRRHPAKFLRPEDVPEFDGEEAWFECERPPRCRWRAVRLIADRKP